ncbi:MAG: hypothetical protein GXY96_08470 [Tissierellia bacterium]|nr:hypothetical protein [Tissierellia bacterium]
MGLLAGGTVIFGLGKIVDVIGKIGPAIVILTIMLGIVAIIMNPSGLATANSIIPQLNLLKASTNWFFSAVSYVGFCLLWQAVARFSEDKTPKFRLLTVIMAGVGVFVGLLVPFDRLVNIIYVINGYVGIILFIFMAYKTIRQRILKSNIRPQDELS